MVKRSETRFIGELEKEKVEAGTDKSAFQYERAMCTGTQRGNVLPWPSASGVSLAPGAFAYLSYADALPLEYLALWTNPICSSERARWLVKQKPDLWRTEAKSSGSMQRTRTIESTRSLSYRGIGSLPIRFPINRLTWVWSQHCSVSTVTALRTVWSFHVSAFNLFPFCVKAT